MYERPTINSTKMVESRFRILLNVKLRNGKNVNIVKIKIFTQTKSAYRPIAIQQ